MADESGARWSAFRYLQRFRGYGRPYIGTLVIGVLLRVGEVLADLAQPWPLAVIIDTVLGHRALTGALAPLLQPFAASRVGLLTAAALASVALAGASGLLDYLGDRIMNGAGERITADIRADLFAHLQRLPLAYHDRRRIGELVSRVSVDTSRIEDVLVDLFSSLLPGILNVAGLLIVMLLINWELGLVAMASAPLVLFTVHRYGMLARLAARVVRSQEGSLAGVVAETLAGIRTVHALGGHDVHDRLFRTQNRQTLQAGLRSVELRARFTPLVETCVALGTGALLWVGTWGVLRGAWTVGVLVVLLTYVRNMLKPIRSLSKLSLTFSRGTASAERVAQILDEPCPRDTPPGLTSVARAAGHIELSGVTFGYDRSSVLRQVNLVIRPGERLALVGPNGAGKSSVLALLARLYDPVEGTILLDGTPYRHCPLAWLRSQIAIVPQEVFLFSGSLWENIAYAGGPVDEARIMAAAAHARVTEFACRLGDGFNTRLGDRGVGLSGGQQQRIAIARALLRDAPIVLLDEPTSGLDLEAEQLVVAALQELMRGRTVIMATHRPALLSLASRIVHLEDGRFHETFRSDRLARIAGKPA